MAEVLEVEAGPGKGNTEDREAQPFANFGTPNMVSHAGKEGPIGLLA